jgi:integrator complex subunit 11
MEVFKKWAPHENNLVIMPGYCVAGTLGHKVLSNGGKPQVIQLPADEGGGLLHVRCKIRHLSFSAHADAKGIMTLIKQVSVSGFGFRVSGLGCSHEGLCR